MHEKKVWLVIRKCLIKHRLPRSSIFSHSNHSVLYWKTVLPAKFPWCFLIFLPHKSLYFPLSQKEMEIHSSVPAWRIPWTEEPDGLQSIESHRVRNDWSGLATHSQIYATLNSKSKGKSTELQITKKWEFFTLLYQLQFWSLKFDKQGG